MEAEEDEKGLGNVYALGFVSFFTDVSSEMVFSLLPVFILGLPGSSKALLGLIEGTAEALSYGMRAVSGVFSDRFRKRKAIILIGYGLSNIVKPLFAVASSALDAFVIRVTDRVGKGVRTAPRDALISESVPEGRRGVAFGLHRTLDQTGAIVGPLAASAILFLGWTVREVFWLSLIPGTVALIVILFFVKERVSGPGGEFRLLRGVRAVMTRDFSMLLVVVGLFSLGAFNFSFVLLNAQESGVTDALIPIVYAAVNVAHTAVAVPAGALSDRIGKERVLVMGYGVFLATALLILLSPSGVASAYGVALSFGLYMGVVETIQRALVPLYAEGGLRGTAYGIYYLVVGSAFFLANAIVGSLWGAYGSSASLYSIASTSIAIVGMFIFLRRSLEA